MEERVLKLMTYLGLLCVIVYIAASATGRRGQLQQPTGRAWRLPRAQGNVWAQKPVPVPATNQMAGVFR